MTQEQDPARAAMSGAVELEAELRAGLEGVTPGPWRLSQEFHCYWVNGVFRSGGYRVENQKQADNFRANGEHLARCSPDNIATLLAQVEKMRTALPDLSYVISWLENGCSVDGAIKELRIYQSRIAALTKEPS